MHYHFVDGSVVVLKSYHIAKIIDYGRSYIPGNKKIHDAICKTKKCNIDEFPPDKKFGDLHIYMDMSAPMQFTKA